MLNRLKKKSNRYTVCCIGGVSTYKFDLDSCQKSKEAVGVPCDLSGFNFRRRLKMIRRLADSTVCPKHEFYGITADKEYEEIINGLLNPMGFNVQYTGELHDFLDCTTIGGHVDKSYRSGALLRVGRAIAKRGEFLDLSIVKRGYKNKFRLDKLSNESFMKIMKLERSIRDNKRTLRKCDRIIEREGILKLKLEGDISNLEGELKIALE